MFGPGSGAILLGDATTHGGRVISGQSNYLVNGKAVAVVGDKVTCPQDGHGVCSIIEGHPTISVNGKAVAFHGSATSCGARLISSCSNAHCIGSPDAPSASDMTPPVQLQQPSPVSSFAEPASAEEPPVVNMAENRWESIVNNTPAVFEIQRDPSASSDGALHELSSTNLVTGNEAMYREVAAEVGVDPNLVMAIAYMETSRGWYDYAYDAADAVDDFVLGGAGFDDKALRELGYAQKTFRPMNVNPDYWAPLVAELEYVREDVVTDPRANIHVGAELLKRIRDRVPSPTMEKIASIYVTLGRENTNDYGARVQAIYDTRPWER